MVRHGSRRPRFVPSQVWPEAVRTAVIDALSEALVRDMLTPTGEPGLENISL
jgi:hypothetical protein